ncbi:MAG: RNA polymerase factor sigma-54 [Candidatus Aminicenantes bacterium]|nr:RNA polymerase factor sigma-54 [Candidatus Aminicenantes bacterium]
MLKQKLDQKQVQKLILAPALQQAIRLLPLTNLELIEVIDAELAENPLLEEMSQGEVQEEGETPEEETLSESNPDEPTSLEETELMTSGNQLGEASWDEILVHYFDDSPDQLNQEPKEPIALENILARGPSLWDHLNWQASLTFFSEDERAIASYIIGNINEDGYLTTSVEEIAASLGVELAQVETVRQKIKGFDPVGSGSLNLQEMMLAQMEHLGINNEITRRIVENYLPILEKADYEQLTRELKISLAELKNHLEILKHLDPAPGRKYSQEKVAYVVPDIIVTKEGDDYKIFLNNEGLPKLRISSFYRQILAKGSQLNPEAYNYLKDRMKRAIWFLKSLNQREQTVFRVAKAIIERQKDFLEKGIDFLKPLTLSEIAEEVEVHESTVGRVVANKYIQTPRGVFSLKYFFHKSLASENGEEVSSLRIKERIKKLIEGEDPANPLSDTDLCDILRRENIKIARRTVAKYRKQLRLPPSHVRKRKFLAEGKK